MTKHFEFSDLTDVDLVRLHLAYGEQNAITQARLARDCGISLRAVQAALEGMKRGGTPIVTGSAGVWLSADAAELRAAYRRDRERAIRQLINNRGRLKAIEALQKIERLTLWSDAA